MKKIIILFIASIVVLSSASAFGELTAEQKAEQRRQQQAAQSAYQASAESYDDAYQSGQELKRDVAKFAKDTAKAAVRM